MKNILTFILLTICFEFCNAQTTQNAIVQLQGTWVNEKNSLSSIYIKDKQWILQYKGDFDTTNSHYNLIFSGESLPGFCALPCRTRRATKRIMRILKHLINRRQVLGLHSGLARDSPEN